METAGENSVITDAYAEKALEYLNSTAKQYGEVCGLVELQAHNIKIYRSLAFLEASGTVAEREATAWVSQMVRDAIETHSNAVAEKLTISTKLKSASLTVDIWRTQAASNRAKMI